MDDKIEFARITYGGASVVVPIEDVRDTIGSLEEGSFSIESVWLTIEEFEALAEFDGF